jgi:hypothetical protein
VDYNPGVTVGQYVVLGNWYSVDVLPERAVNWTRYEVVAVSGKEVTWRMTGQLKNGSAIPNNGETYTVNVETGTTNYTHSVQGLIIAANLNKGEKVTAGSPSFEVNETEINTYLSVSRTVNILVFESSGVGTYGTYNTTSTYTYDKASGIMLENENRIKWSNANTLDHFITMTIIETNIFSPSPQINQIPIEIVYAVVAAVVIAPIGATAVILRRRKQPEAKPNVMETKQIDLSYNLSGVNRGECYLTESLEHCVKVVCELHSRGVSALAIVREDPEFLTKTCKLQPDDVVLLASKPIKGFKAISTLQEISIVIMKFIKAGGGVVLLDGLEYLISRFGFNTVYMCLQEKKIEFLEAGAVLLVPLNMETLDNREKGQLFSELKLL